MAESGGFITGRVENDGGPFSSSQRWIISAIGNGRIIHWLEHNSDPTARRMAFLSKRIAKERDRHTPSSFLPIVFGRAVPRSNENIL